MGKAWDWLQAREKAFRERSDRGLIDHWVFSTQDRKNEGKKGSEQKRRQRKRRKEDNKDIQIYEVCWRGEKIQSMLGTYFGGFLSIEFFSFFSSYTLALSWVITGLTWEILKTFLLWLCTFSIAFLFLINLTIGAWPYSQSSPAQLAVHGQSIMLSHFLRCYAVTFRVRTNKSDLVPSMPSCLCF